MSTRREFLAKISLPAAVAIKGVPGTPAAFRSSAPEIIESLSNYSGNPKEVAQNEDYWYEIAKAFTVDRSLINFNNGGGSPSPAFVQEAMKRHLDFSNLAPSYTMWDILEPQQETVRKRMAREWDVESEEICITRGASESLQICQLGYDLNKGDEVLTSTQDYGRMLTTFKQRERREGIVLKQIELPVPAEDNSEIVRCFEKGITEKTRLILMCHMINLTGQILPVRDVVTMARGHKIPVIVDGAHALAHFDFKISDLNCDNYSTSLHKWLFAPHGTGLLYVRREVIPNIWPLMAASNQMNNNIRKFEEIGTHPAANHLAIAEALTFHQGIGSKRKTERLVYLRDRWAKRLLEHDRIRIHTSLKHGFACGIGNVQIEGEDTSILRNWLWNEHRILTVSINHPQFQGLRISPSVYSTLEEVDRFIEAMEYVLKRGLPKSE